VPIFFLLAILLHYAILEVVWSVDEGEIGHIEIFISSLNIVVLNKAILYPDLTLQC
jgi:hypothetical protein